MSGGSEMQTQGIHTYYIQGQSGVPGVIIKGCDIYNTKGTGAGCEGGGNGVFCMGGGSNPNDNLLLTCNRLYNNDRAGFATKNGLDHSEFTYNEVFGNGGGANVGDYVGGLVFRCKSSHYHTVEFNYIYDNVKLDTHQGTGIFVGGNYNDIMNNYIENNDVGINFGRSDGSNYNEIYDNVVSNHPYTDVKSVGGKINTGDNNCADTAINYQDDNPAPGEDFTYDTSNLIPCYYDFDQDSHYSSAYCYGQSILNVGICCLPGSYDGSPEGMTHHEAYADCIWSEGDDPHDCRAYTITGEVLDTDGSTPVTNPTVVIKNIHTAQEWDATVVSNDFSLNIEPELDISPYDMLRITANDDVPVEGWTDHKVHEADLALGGYTADVILDNYQLNYFPSYPYYQQEQAEWSGPAVMQACIGHYIEPPTQEILDTEGRDNNLQCNKDAGILYVDPEGMETTMDTYLQPEGRNYAIYDYENTGDGLNDALHKICYWQKLGPAAVPAYEDYSNWMTIRGIRTSDIPDDYSAPYEYDAIGFWVNDPNPIGIGENMYVTADTWTTNYYKPLAQLTVPDDPYNDQYVCIVEPPEDNAQTPQAHVNILRSSAQFTARAPTLQAKHSTIQGITVNSQEINEQETLDVIQAAINGVTTELIPYDAAFAAVFEQTIAGEPFYVDDTSGNYWLVPFTEIEEIDKTMVVIRISAEDGRFLDASWVNHGVKYLPVSQEDALKLILEQTRCIQSMKQQPTIKLIHTKGSMYYPSWLITIGTQQFLVNQEGDVQHLTLSLVST
jgi:hypothetical protein